MLVVHIHRATGIKKMDTTGSSGTCLSAARDLNDS